jgi:hypothetical protein
VHRATLLLASLAEQTNGTLAVEPLRGAAMVWTVKLHPKINVVSILSKAVGSAERSTVAKELEGSVY